MRTRPAFRGRAPRLVPAVLPRSDLTAAESLRIFFMRSSGAKGFPFSMPMDANKASLSGSSASLGSCCTTSFRSDRRRIAENFLHALIGGKRLPLLNADGCEQGQPFGVERLAWFLLYYLVPI